MPVHGQAMRAALGQCQPHSSVQGETLVGSRHISRVFGILWELPGGQPRIASLHCGFKENPIRVHGSCTEVSAGLQRLAVRSAALIYSIRHHWTMPNTPL